MVNFDYDRAIRFLMTGFDMATPTPFGKELRKLRLDRDETMADMARRVGRSASFLSSIETGKKAVPIKLVDELAESYLLDGAASEHLHELAEANTGIFKLPTVDAKSYTLVSTLARKLESLSDDQHSKILGILDEDA